MVNIKKIRWIPILMVFSQVLLAGFVAYWLMSQYTDEKKILHEDLNRIYEESRNQVIDSLLFNRVVEPALNDTVTITLSTGEKVDTAGHKIFKAFNSNILTGKRDSFCTPSIVAVSMPDSLAGKRIRSGTAFAFSNTKQDFLIRSVRLFINHSGDSAAGSSELPGFLPGNPDTALFKKVYSEKIEVKKLGVTVIWNPDIGRNAREAEDVNAITNVKIVKNQDNPGVHFTSVLPDNFPRVEIRHQFPYLIGRISPQILFAMILLILTGSAFFFTNRSLKRQLILNSLRNDFVSNITHELRTPVSTVKVALEALKTYDKVSNPEVTRDYLDMASQEMNRLDQLIGKVLDQSLISEQRQVIQPEPSELKYLIDNVLLTMQPRLEARHAMLKFDAPEEMELILVDPLHFQGVLINLIDNSLKYGSDKPEIEIRLWKDDKTACIEVSDNGPGIPKEYLGRVFDKFFRVPGGNVHNVKGYGLGLSFAALVMKQHNGSISVRNLEPCGCSFTVRLPLIPS